MRVNWKFNRWMKTCIEVRLQLEFGWDLEVLPVSHLQSVRATRVLYSVA